MPEPELDQRRRTQPASRRDVTAVSGSSAAASGTIAAKISGDTDESGPKHEHARRAEDGVPDEATDRRVQARHCRETGELRIRHALRNEDRGEHQPGDQVGPHPRPLVLARSPNGRDPAFQRCRVLAHQAESPPVVRTGDQIMLAPGCSANVPRAAARHGLSGSSTALQRRSARRSRRLPSIRSRTGLTSLHS